jgi:hypothetical protein
MVYSPHNSMKLIQTRPPALQPAFRMLARMEATSTRATDILEQSAKITFDGIWNNPDATPAVMLAAMGTEAVGGFAAHYHTVLALRAAGKDTSAYDTPPLSYTAHADGTITLD